MLQHLNLYWICQWWSGLEVGLKCHRVKRGDTTCTVDHRANAKTRCRKPSTLIQSPGHLTFTLWTERRKSWWLKKSYLGTDEAGNTPLPARKTLFTQKMAQTFPIQKSGLMTCVLLPCIGKKAIHDPFPLVLICQHHGLLHVVVLLLRVSCSTHYPRFHEGGPGVCQQGFDAPFIHLKTNKQNNKQRDCYTKVIQGQWGCQTLWDSCFVFSCQDAVSVFKLMLCRKTSIFFSKLFTSKWVEHFC